MAKLSKAESRKHLQALELLGKFVLIDQDRDFVFAIYHEGSTHINGVAGAFFTPQSLAWDALRVRYRSSGRFGLA